MCPIFRLQVISAVLFVVVGVLFLRNPEAGLLSLTLLLIMLFMVEGFSKVIFSLTIRPFPNWGWVLAKRGPRHPAVFPALGEHCR